jgi:hypothetical protein
VAKRICDALRIAGIEALFDQSELRGGDAWDQKIRSSCAPGNAGYYYRSYAARLRFSANRSFAKDGDLRPRAPSIAEVAAAVSLYSG